MSQQISKPPMKKKKKKKKKKKQVRSRQLELKLINSYYG